jgi:hypothetical protein
MVSAGGWFALWLAGSAPAAGTPAPAPASEGPEEFRAARVEVVGLDEAEVLAALRLRLPGMSIERHAGPPPTVTPHVYLKISRVDARTGRLRAITSDGRAYDRRFDATTARVAAGTAATLLFAIAAGGVTPDREDVEIPPGPPAPETSGPTPTETPAPPDPPPEAEPTPPAPTPEPTTPPDPSPADPPTSSPPASPPPARAPPRWEYGLALHGVAALGLGRPVYGGALAGLGGGLGLEVRAPRGVLFGLELRGLGRTRDALGVGRLRVALAAGYAWRRGRFELPVVLAVAIEPWWTTRDGAAAEIFAGRDAVRRPPLLGGLLRLTPALRLPLARGPLRALRIGPRLELAGAFAVADGARVLGLYDPDGAARLRLGGLELSLGLDLTLVFGRPPR